MTLFSCLTSCFRWIFKQKAPLSPLHASLIAICGESDVAVPGHASYDDWARPYNCDKSVAVAPVAITRPANALEVAEIVRYARENDYKVQAKSGGHSYA
jgi:FAD/FMN-containing dehydrogenase